MRATFAAHGSSVMHPLSQASVRRSAGQTCGLMLRASPLRGIAPSRYGVGSSACQALFLRSHAHHRPHVSISWALPQALASCGILPNTPCGWHLLTTTRESTCQVTPFPVPMAHIRRAVLSTGFLGRADRSVSRAAGAVSCAIVAPACQPLSAGSRSRWLATPLLTLPLDACETGYPD